jgi:hypothetical protein
MCCLLRRNAPRLRRLAAAANACAPSSRHMASAAAALRRSAARINIAAAATAWRAGAARVVRSSRKRAALRIAPPRRVLRRATAGAVRRSASSAA